MKLIKLWEGGVSKDKKLREYVTNEVVFETSWIESKVRISRLRGTTRFVSCESGLGRAGWLESKWVAGE